MISARDETKPAHHVARIREHCQEQTLNDIAAKLPPMRDFRRQIVAPEQRQKLLNDIIYSTKSWMMKRQICVIILDNGGYLVFITCSNDNL